MKAGSDELTLHLDRVLPAPRSVVFSALIEPDELAKWWGPKGFAAPSIELKPHVGGTYRIAMQPPDGELFHLSGEFRDVDAPARLAYTFRAGKSPFPTIGRRSLRSRFAIWADRRR